MIKKSPIDRISLNNDYSDNDLNTLKALILFGAYYLSFYTYVIVTILFKQLKTDIPEVTEEISYQSITSAFTGTIIAAIVFIFLSKKLIKLSLDKRRIVDAAWVRGNFNELLQGVIYGIFISFILLAIFGPTQSLNEQSNDLPSTVVLLVKTVGIWGALIHILHIFIFSSLEELIFRGLLLGGVTRNYGLTMGIVISTILFIVIHYPFPHLSYIVIYLIISIITIYLRLKTKAIGPSILCHITYNLAVLIFTNILF